MTLDEVRNVCRPLSTELSGKIRAKTDTISENFTIYWKEPHVKINYHKFENYKGSFQFRRIYSHEGK